MQFNKRYVYRIVSTSANCGTYVCVVATCTESAVKLCNNSAPHVASEYSDYSDLCKWVEHFD